MVLVILILQLATNNQVHLEKLSLLKVIIIMWFIIGILNTSLIVHTGENIMSSNNRWKPFTMYLVCTTQK